MSAEDTYNDVEPSSYSDTNILLYPLFYAIDTAVYRDYNDVNYIRGFVSYVVLAMIPLLVTGVLLAGIIAWHGFDVIEVTNASPQMPTVDYVHHTLSLFLYGPVTLALLCLYKIFRGGVQL
jgi:hypothetical protein